MVDDCKRACYDNDNCTETASYCIYEIANALIDAQKWATKDWLEDTDIEKYCDFSDYVINILHAKRVNRKALVKC